MSYRKLIYSERTGEPSLSRLTVLVAQLLAAVFFAAWNLTLLRKAWESGQIPSGLIEFWLVYTAVAGVQYSASKYMASKGQPNGVTTAGLVTQELAPDSGGGDNAATGCSDCPHNR